MKKIVPITSNSTLLSMQKLITYALLLFISLFSYAQKSDASAIEACGEYEALASTIMSKRQFGVSMSQMMGLVGDNNLVKEIVMMAYEQDRYISEGGKNRAIEEFRNKVFLDCFKELRNSQNENFKTLSDTVETVRETNEPSASCNVDLANIPQYNGIYKCSYSNGNKSEEGCYIDGKKESGWKTWHVNGNIKEEDFFNMGKPIGEGYLYDDNGKLLFKNYYGGDLLGSFVNGEFIDNFSHIDKQTCFCGSDSDRINFLKKKKIGSCDDL
jgi:hypothetical protein